MVEMDSLISDGGHSEPKQKAPGQAEELEGRGSLEPEPEPEPCRPAMSQVWTLARLQEMCSVHSCPGKCIKVFPEEPFDNP